MSDKKCDFCDKACGNDWCVVHDEPDNIDIEILEEVLTPVTKNGKIIIIGTPNKEE
jgi:hypothetical protein